MLVPAYHCGTEVEALMRAGVECRFYEGSASLEPDEDELAQLLDERVAALYLIHYLGFPQDVPRWRRWCDAHDVLLIEDVAQGWFGTIDGRPIGSLGDLSIFTFYKTLGLPDGAALLFRDGLDALAQRGASGLGMVGIRHAEWLLARSARLTDLEDRLRSALKRVRRGDDPATSADARGDFDCPPARTTRFLLPRLVDATIAERRRRNYERLLVELGDVVANPFAWLPVGACPWAFMVDVEDSKSHEPPAASPDSCDRLLAYSPTPRSPLIGSLEQVHYERASSGFLFTRSFANAIWRGWGQRSETPSSRTGTHRELRVHRERPSRANERGTDRSRIRRCAAGIHGA